MYETRRQTGQNNDENKRVDGRATEKDMPRKAQRRALGDVAPVSAATCPQQRQFGTNITNRAQIEVKEEKDKGTCDGQAEAHAQGQALAESERMQQPARGNANDSESDAHPGPVAAPGIIEAVVARMAAAAAAAPAVAADASSMFDIDSRDGASIRHVAAYVDDIHASYRQSETESRVAADYMLRQTDINDKMRAILLDWLVEVHLKFKLMPETLYLTVNLTDRFLAVTPTLRRNLQLVGVTALLLACKYEEIWAPEVKDFVYITDNAYTREQILAMEKQMLNTLNFNLSVPTAYVFTARFIKASDAPADSKVDLVAWFMVDLALLECTMLRFSPSLIAAAAVYTARRTVNMQPFWSAALAAHSGFTEAHLRVCASMMSELHEHAGTGNLVAVHRKYSGPRWGEVARLPHASMPADDSASHC
eukprot:jgi/Mesen1/8021/ME000426S07164